MMLSESHITTDKSVVYMQRLCRHFAHKVPAECDEAHGRVQFAMGVCEMRATGTNLILRAQADNPEALERLKAVVSSHLERFAFREELKVQWKVSSQQNNEDL